jgi:hypothetical protein
MHGVASWVIGTTSSGMGRLLPLLLLYIDWSEILFIMPGELKASM